MYVLYHNPYSPHARRVVSLLEEAGLAYELCHVAMDEGEHLSPAYLAINPNHQVPALLDGNVKIFESNAILRYLCIKHVLLNWYPQDLPARAAVEQWLDWNQCRLAPAMVDVVLNKVFLGEAGDKEAVVRGEKKLAELIPILDAGLQDCRFLAGETPTIADLSVASNIYQLGLAKAVTPSARMASWYQRISGLAGYRKSLPGA